MATRMITALVLTAAFAGAASAQTAPRTAFTIQPESKLSVAGGSTVRGWTCNATGIDGAVLSDDTSLSIVRASAAAASATLTVDVAALDCGNGTMNSHMRRALKQPTAPQIMFRYQRMETAAGGTARITGNLTLAGETRLITLDGQLLEEPGGALRLRGTHTFNMTEFGVQPPRLMAGTMKVHDPVTVSFDVLFRP
jgi:polyisoprenoid-binding protein YceI